MKKKITMQDIANEVGVSVVTVSNALAGRTGVSPETKDEILDVSKKLGYEFKKENKKADKSTRIIGILVADRFFADNKFYQDLYRSILLEANAENCSILLEIVSPLKEADNIMPSMLETTNKVDGIIFMGEIDRDYLKMVAESNIPYILLDFYDYNIPATSIVSDGFEGAYKLTSLAIEKGKESFGFLGTINSTSSINDRYLGFYKALLDNGIKINPDWIIEDRDARGEFIPIKLPDIIPEVFVCSCDEVAYRLIEKLKLKAYEIPEEVAVLGYDDNYFAKLARPQLTSYHVDTENMAKNALMELAKAIDGEVSNKIITIRGELVERDSLS